MEKYLRNQILRIPKSMWSLSEWLFNRTYETTRFDFDEDGDWLEEPEFDFEPRCWEWLASISDFVREWIDRISSTLFAAFFDGSTAHDVYCEEFPPHLFPLYHALPDFGEEPLALIYPPLFPIN